MAMSQRCAGWVRFIGVVLLGQELILTVQRVKLASGFAAVVDSLLALVLMLCLASVFFWKVG